MAVLRKELRAQGNFNLDFPKPVLEKILQEILKRVHRVPTLLLLLQPQQPLCDLHLQHYTILDCEPLHDLKCHISNLLYELPAYLPVNAMEEYTKRITFCTSKDKTTGADLRTTVIDLLMQAQADAQLLQLLQTVIRVSEALYTGDDQRTSRMLLQLYNCTWLHHELCGKLFSHPRSRQRLYGSYLHSLSAHAALQYEIVCLKLVNAENRAFIWTGTSHSTSFQ